ncbi:MAG: sensor histidine kinase [Bacillota bacterium]|nr:sensor histidine kinase [Bacillota bacterium]
MTKLPLFRYFKTIRVQIAAYYLITSIVLVALMGMVLYYSLSSIFLNDALKVTTTAVEQNGRSIEIYLDKLKTLSNVISSDTDTYEYLTSDNQTSRDRTVELMATILESDPYLTTGILVSKDGRIISSDEYMDMGISENMMNEPWYMNVLMKNNMPVLTSIRRQSFSMDKSTWVISVGQEISDSDGNNIGVLILDFSYEVIENQLNSLDLGNNGFAFILTQNGEVVFHEDPKYFEEENYRNKLVEISQMSDGYDSEMDLLTHHYELAGTDWILVGLSSLDNMDAARRQIFETIIMVGIILLAIVFGSSLIMASKITKPIRELEVAMRNLSTEFSKVPEVASDSYEVESLKKRFNEMIIRIQELMEGIKENEKYLRESEIRSLYSQINPHFLYNTLDTIVWMAEFGDSEKVIATTKSLAQFFRISLSQGSESITLGEEIEHIKQYMFIQKQRYGDHLTYDIECPEEYKSIPVPKIILQPIVENAIYHGIKELDGVGFIKISAEKKEHQLVLKVSDNGVGFDSSTEKSTLTKLGGVGIDNVNKRLKLICGDESGVLIDSKVDVGTEVTFTIPVDNIPIKGW